jgi:magnesium-transporting ATPase (P-type)
MERDLETARTMAVNTLVAMEIFYLFSIRYGYGSSLTWRGTLGTRPVLISLIVVTIAQLLFIYAPFMQDIFETRALEPGDLLMVLATGAALFAIIELEKQVRLALRRKQETQCQT